MQTVIQVITSGRGSLREKIMTDPQLRKFDLIPTEHQRPGRPHGWAKIHSETAHGAINLEWHGRTGVLTCRVVTKLGHKPHSIIGDFIDYLLARPPEPHSRHSHYAAVNSRAVSRGRFLSSALFSDAVHSLQE
jgi:hypothetical protein